MFRGLQLRMIIALCGLCLGLGGAMVVGTAGADPNPDPSLAGEWHLDTVTTAGASQATPDDSVNAAPLYVAGATPYPGRFGEALAFNGIGGLTANGPQPQLQPPHLTVVAWVDGATPGDYKSIVAQGGTPSSCNQASYALYTGSDGGLSFYISNSASTTIRSASAGPGIWNDRWHAVAGTYDGNSVRLYVDGQEVGTPTAATGSAIDYALPDTYFSVGNWHACSGFGFPGATDEVRVYDRALSAAEIAVLQDPAATQPPNLNTTPANTAPPQISGTPQNGDQLTCSTVSWTVGAGGAQPTGYSYVWERGARSAGRDDPSWTPITDATASTYTVTGTDDGLRVRCRVIASYGVNSTQAVSASVRTDAAGPTIDDNSYPQVTGTPIVGQTLTCDPGPLVSDPSQPGWHNYPDFSYQWTRNGSPIDGATSSTYTPTPYRQLTGAGWVLNMGGDGDHTIGCTVTGTNDLGGSAVSSSNSPYVVDGPPMPDQLPKVTVVPDDPSNPSPLAESVSCDPGTWYEGNQFTYQWLRNGTPITGATSQTYRVTVEDFGRTLSCEVTDTNVAGTSKPVDSGGQLIPLPTGTQDIDIYHEGGSNQVDPTNLLGVTRRYEKAIQAYTISKLQEGITARTAACKSLNAKHPYPPISKKHPIRDPIGPGDQCRILLFDPTHVVAEPSGGVRWISDNCEKIDYFAADCTDLNIEVSPIDPLKPPALSGDELASIGPTAPAQVLWDLNGDGRTDAICPGSAPVLSSIFDYNRQWHPHVTVIDQDGTVHSGDISLQLGSGGQPGELRPSQIRVCMTSFDPPPTTQLPCVTTGQIGSIQISHANLCPIDARQINPSDFDQLLPPDLQGYLFAASEGALSKSGVITDRAGPRPGGAPVKPTYVPWSSAVEPDTAIRVRPARGPHAVDAAQDIATGSVAGSTIAATTASTIASLTSENSPATYPKLNLAGVNNSAHGIRTVSYKDFKFAFDPDKAALAYDQIYLARGPGGSSLSNLEDAANQAGSIVPGVTGDAGEALLDGVGFSAAPDATGQATGLLLIGSDVAGALPGVKSFTLAGRNLAPTLGIPTDPKAVALGEAHAYTQQLKDSVTAEAKAEATQALDQAAGNLDQMTQDYQKDAKAYGQQLLDRVKNSLHLGPFDFSGDAHVAVNKDGTATLTVSASLPGLTGAGPKIDAEGHPELGPDGKPKSIDGSAVTGIATFHADQEGHLALRGVHISAPHAFFLGIELRGVDVTYNSDTGFDLKAQILIQAAGDAGFDIKNFQLDANGNFQDLAVDYLAGAGTGIPIFTGAFITQLGFDLNTVKSKFDANIGVAIGAGAGGGCIPLGAKGTVSVQLDQPVDVKGTVSPQVFCLPFGNVTFEIKGDGSVSLAGNWGLHADLVNFDLGLGADFGGAQSIAPGAFQVWAGGKGDVAGIIQGKIKAVISSKGLAACGGLDIEVPGASQISQILGGGKVKVHIEGGAAESFKHGVPLTAPQILAGLQIFTGCDIHEYFPLGVPQALASRASRRRPADTAPAGVESFRLPAHQGPTIMSFTGAGQAPRFTLRSPSGRSYDLTQTGAYGSRLAGGAWGSNIDQVSKTFVIIGNPLGGRWTVQLAPGSAQILRVDAAGILPPPGIKAHISGHGATRALHYGAVREPGQTIRISEQAAGENQQIAMIGASAHEKLQRGTVHYTLGESTSRTRRIVAEVFQNGLPRRELLLARYRAANPQVGPVRALSVRRRGKRALISWRPGTLDRTYYVRIKYGDGRVVLGVTRHRRFVSARIAHGEGLRVVVYALSAAGRPSREAKTALAGSMLVGSVHQLPPYKAHKPSKSKSAKSGSKPARSKYTKARSSKPRSKTVKSKTKLERLRAS